MTLSLTEETQRLLEDRIAAGGYSSPELAIRAALLALQQQEHAGDFAPGEMDELLAVADAEIDRGDVLDGDEALAQRRARRAARSESGR